jgi:hypothetical protein
MDRAKAAAREFFAKAVLGTDPVAERAAAKAKAKRTLGSVIERYMEARKPAWRPNSYRHNDRYLRRYFASLHNTPIDNVERADVAEAVFDLTKAHGAVTADRAKKSWRNGYSPLPCHGKRPAMDEWQNHHETNTPIILRGAL